MALRMAKETLAPEQVEQFRTCGYTVLRGGFDAGAMTAIEGWTRELVALPEASGRHWVFRDPDPKDPGARLVNRIERIAPFHAPFRQVIEALKPPVAQLLGETATLFKEKINFKFPGGDGFKPHQDAQAGWTTYADFFVSALVSIDAATPANGCLQIVRDYRHQGLFDLWKPLTDADLAGLHWIDLPTEPGDVIFFDCFVPHASQPNRTQGMRRIYYATFNRASAGYQTDRYYADKWRNFPPDIDREQGKTYVFRV